jgi:hypothetical protein
MCAGLGAPQDASVPGRDEEGASHLCHGITISTSRGFDALALTGHLKIGQLGALPHIW